MVRPSADYGALLDALRGVTWPARVTSRGASAGTHKSRLRGSSAEFTEYRAYRQGDDPRRLDWKLLARTDRAFLRITNERATLPTVLVVDASASMAFERKWDAARALAVGLAGVAFGTGDPVGLSVRGGPAGGLRLPLRARRGVVSELARSLDGIMPSGTAVLSGLVREERAAARLVVITDLLGGDEGLLRAAGEQVARGTEVTVVHLIAREELEPPEGTRLAEDPEAPRIRRPLTGATRAAYLAAFGGWLEETGRAWRGSGAQYLRVTTDEPAERAVRRITGGGAVGRRSVEVP